MTLFSWQSAWNFLAQPLKKGEISEIERSNLLKPFHRIISDLLNVRYFLFKIFLGKNWTGNKFLSEKWTLYTGPLSVGKRGCPRGAGRRPLPVFPGNSVIFKVQFFASYFLQSAPKKFRKKVNSFDSLTPETFHQSV